MKALLYKDFRNALWAFGPAMTLWNPLFFSFYNLLKILDPKKISWKSAFWITFFISSTSLYFRSFGLENRFKNFHIYTAYRIPKLKIFFSQTLLHFVTVSILGASYLFLTVLFWSPIDLNLPLMLTLVLLVAGCLSPLGTLLGLILQLEREFLFSVIYLPLATPVILSAHSLSLAEASTNWLFVLLSFLIGGLFLSALIFEFFFDELS